MGLYINHTQTGGEVLLDGNEYIDSKFDGARMIFRGLAPVTFRKCFFKDVIWEFDGPAGMTLEFLLAMSAMDPEMGNAMLVGTFPQLKSWLKPDILTKFEAGMIS